MSDSGPSDPPSKPEAVTSRGDPRATPPPPIEVVSPELLLPGTEPLDPYREIFARLDRAVADDIPPDLLQLGGEEAFGAYQEAFDRLLQMALPIFDPRGFTIEFDEDACRHVCYAEDRFDKRRKRAEREERVREVWQQDRAEHLLWVLPALVRPVEIVENNQVRDYEAYLLGYPRSNPVRPSPRYYLSVRPVGPKRRLFKTAYPCDQRYWDNARRGQPGRAHTLYRDLGRRR